MFSTQSGTSEFLETLNFPFRLQSHFGMKLGLQWNVEPRSPVFGGRAGFSPGFPSQGEDDESLKLQNIILLQMTWMGENLHSSCGVGMDTTTWSTALNGGFRRLPPLCVCVAWLRFTSPRGGSAAADRREGMYVEWSSGKKAQQGWMPACCRHARTNPFSCSPASSPARSPALPTSPNTGGGGATGNGPRVACGACEWQKWWRCRSAVLFMEPQASRSPLRWTHSSIIHNVPIEPLRLSCLVFDSMNKPTRPDVLHQDCLTSGPQRLLKLDRAIVCPLLFYAMMLENHHCPRAFDRLDDSIKRFAISIRYQMNTLAKWSVFKFYLVFE